MSQEKTKVRTWHIASNVKRWFKREVAKLVAKGYAIEKRWKKYGSHFADLTLKVWQKPRKGKKMKKLSCAIISGLCAGLAGYAVYQYTGNVWAGAATSCALESFGFFLLWAAQIVAEVIKVAWMAVTDKGSSSRNCSRVEKRGLFLHKPLTYFKKYDKRFIGAI